MTQAQLKNRVEQTKLSKYLAAMERERRFVSKTYYEDLLTESEFAAKCKRDADDLARRDGPKRRRRTTTRHLRQPIKPRRDHDTLHSRRNCDIGGCAGCTTTDGESGKLQKVRRRLGEQTRQARGIARNAPKIRRRVAKMNLQNKPPLSLPPIPEGRATNIPEDSLATPHRLLGDQQSEAAIRPPNDRNISSDGETSLPPLVPPGGVIGGTSEVSTPRSHMKYFGKISALVLSPIDEHETKAFAKPPPPVAPVRHDSPAPVQAETDDTSSGKEIEDPHKVSATSLPKIHLRATGDMQTQSFGTTIVTVTVERRKPSRDTTLPPLVVSDYRKFAFSKSRTYRRPEAQLQPKRSSWTDFWIGEPDAIGSVRRARVAPEQLSQRSWANSVKLNQILIADEAKHQVCMRQLPRVAVSLPQLR